MRVLIEGLPETGPHTRHLADGQEFGITDHLLWWVVWSTWENTVATLRAAGNKKAKMPADKRPLYPWSDPLPAEQKLFGRAGDHTQEEILAYLDNL